MANKRENTEAKSEQFEPRVTALVCAMLMFFPLTLSLSLGVFSLFFFRWFLILFYGILILHWLSGNELWTKTRIKCDGRQAGNAQNNDDTYNLVFGLCKLQT